ncbi:metallophosphoesterase [Metabacillus mangrovi]|nr:metallophosphoesterase [Metabacillus mangrovi]
MRYMRAGLIATVIVVLTAAPFKGHADEGFSFVWMSDTQYYAKDYPEILMSQMNWILKNRSTQRHSYLVHTGDLVHNPNQFAQWERNHIAFSKLDQQGFAYGLLPGNHDFKQEEGLQPYYRFFGEHRFKEKPFYKGAFLDNCGHYDEAGGRLFVYMGWCSAGKKELDWMNTVLKENQDKEAVLAVHDYLTFRGTRSYNGEKIYRQVVVPNPNVKLVLSGHYYGEAAKTDRPQEGRIVHQLMANYQGFPQGGGGYMKVIQWRQDELVVRTYSPYLNKEREKPYTLKYK